MPTVFVCTQCFAEYDNAGDCVDCNVALIPADEAGSSLDDVIEDEDRGFGFNGSDSYDDEDMV